jgi:predicted DNA binding CopG/RHH family protein
MTARQKTEDEQILSVEHFHDPYDAMSDEEFSSYVDRLFGDSQGPTRSITIRMPEDLLNRIQRIAAGRRVPYQRLMKRMLEESVSGLERRARSAERTAPRGTRAPTAKPRARER